MGQFQLNLAKTPLCVKDYLILKKEIMVVFFSLNQWYSHSFGQICILIWTVSKVSNVAHGRLVFFSATP